MLVWILISTPPRLGSLRGLLAVTGLHVLAQHGPVEDLADLLVHPVLVLLGEVLAVGVVDLYVDAGLGPEGHDQVVRIAFQYVFLHAIPSPGSLFLTRLVL